MNIPKIEPKVTHRCCPKCGYLITQKQADLSRIDFDCPACKEHKFSEFQPLKDK